MTVVGQQWFAFAFFRGWLPIWVWLTFQLDLENASPSDLFKFQHVYVLSLAGVRLTQRLRTPWTPNGRWLAPGWLTRFTSHRFTLNAHTHIHTPSPHTAHTHTPHTRTYSLEHTHAHTRTNTLELIHSHLSTRVNLKKARSRGTHPQKTHTEHSHNGHNTVPCRPSPPPPPYGIAAWP